MFPRPPFRQGANVFSSMSADLLGSPGLTAISISKRWPIPHQPGGIVVILLGLNFL